MGNDFHNNFFGKIVVKIFVVCEGLYSIFFKKVHECHKFSYISRNLRCLCFLREFQFFRIISAEYFKSKNFNSPK